MYFYILLACFAYLLGSIPFGLLISKRLLNIDVTKHGSNNIGATNVLRLGNKKVAFLTLILDISKGLIPILISNKLGLDYPLIIGLFALIGHIFPIWLKFRGGKGIATYIGILIATSPVLAILFITVWLIIFLIYRYSSLSAICSVIFTPVMYISFQTKLFREKLDIYSIIHNTELFNLNLTIILFMTSILIYRHIENIKRLIAGKEPKFKDK